MLHFNIRILRVGDAYGLNDCLIAEQPMVEFYDPRFTHGRFDPKLGQFVTRYWIETLMDSRALLEQKGLCLDGGIPAWTVSASQMREVFAILGSKEVAA